MVEKEATPEKPKQMGNREKMRRKEENWEVVTITMNISTINIKIINTFLINTVIIMFIAIIIILINKGKSEFNGQVSLSDDSWYKAPQFRPEVCY